MNKLKYLEATHALSMRSENKLIHYVFIYLVKSFVLGHHFEKESFDRTSVFFLFNV